MCIAILKTKKGIISDEALINSFSNNKDGAGIAYTVNNQLIIQKGIFNVNEFVNAVRTAERICDNNMLIHCRIGTSGEMDALNTHPFLVNDNVCLIHNGILDIEVPIKSKINDTQIFINKYLKDISSYNLLHNKAVKKLIEKLIDDDNKFVMLNNKGYYKIFNEDAGHWKDGVWYSNSSYQTKKISWYDYDDYYNWSNTYRTSNMTITQEEYTKIEDKILCMSIAEILELGEYPAYSLIEDKFINGEKVYDKNGFLVYPDYYFLDDISASLQQFYEETYEYALEEDAAITMELEEENIDVIAG